MFTDGKHTFNNAKHTFTIGEHTFSNGEYNLHGEKSIFASQWGIHFAA